MSPASIDSEIDSTTRNIVDEMIKKNDTKEINSTLNILSNEEFQMSDDRNPFKRKPVAENQVIEEEKLGKFNQIPKQKMTSIDIQNNFELINLKKCQSQEKIKNIVIKEFDSQKFCSLVESTGSKSF